MDEATTPQAANTDREMQEGQAAEEMQDYDVTITETLKKTVTVEAMDKVEAEEIVTDAWRNSEHILDADNFIGVEFEAKPTERELAHSIEPQVDGGTHNMGDGSMDAAIVAGDMTPPEHGTADAPLAENQYVKELLGILGDNGRDASGLAALLGRVSEMEGFVKRAEDKIAEMKSQLDDMKELQGHPVKAALKSAIRSLETKVAEIKAQLAELKNNIVDGCKNAVAAFKETGASALDKLASFFNIKGNLQSISKNIEANIKTDDKAIAKIEAFSKQYHKTGLGIRNMGRVLAGKQPIDTEKENGKLAKAISAPYKTDRAILTGMKKTVDKAIESLGQLENNVAARQEARGNGKKPKQAERAIEEKPSLLNELYKNIELIEQAKREAQVQQRAKAKETAL